MYLPPACSVLQDASKRPGTKSLLALESVREHAKQLHLEMPPVPASEFLDPSTVQLCGHTWGAPHCVQRSEQTSILQSCKT